MGLVLMGFFALGLGQTLDASLEYVEFPTADAAYAPAGIQFMKAEPVAAGASQGMPELTGPEPRSCASTFNGQPVLLVFDRKAAEDPFYSRMRADANMNGDLNDDAPVEGEVRQNGTFSEAKFRFNLKIQGKPYLAEVRLVHSKPGAVESMLRYLAGEPAGYYVTVSSSCAYRGTVDLAGKKYWLWVDDGNCDGVFGKDAAEGPRSLRRPGAGSAGEDYIYLEEAGAYKAAPEDGPEREQLRSRQFGLPITEQLGIGSQLFDLALDTDAMKVTLNPVSGNDARAKFAMPMEGVAFCSDDGKRRVGWSNPPETIALSPGKYYATSYIAFRKESGGGLWQVSCDDEKMRVRIVELASGQEALLPFGEPYRAQVVVKDVNQSFFGGKTARLTFDVVGSGQEECAVEFLNGQTQLPLSSNRSMPREPIVKALKPDGEVAWQGTFRYG